MFCNQCGKQLPDNAAFCPECGAVREQEPDTVKEVIEEKTASSQAAAPIQNMAFNPIPAENKEKDTKDYVQAYWSLEKGIYEGEISTFNVLKNGNESLIAYILDGNNDSSALYYMKSDLEPKLVAENVGTYAVSYTGDYIAYVQADGFEGGELYLYCVKDGKITQIDTDVFPGYQSA